MFYRCVKSEAKSENKHFNGNKTQKDNNNKKMQTLAVYKPYIQTLCTNHIYKPYVHTIYTDPMYEYKGHEHNARVTYRLVSLIHP